MRPRGRYLKRAVVEYPSWPNTEAGVRLLSQAPVDSNGSIRVARFLDLSD